MFKRFKRGMVDAVEHMVAAFVYGRWGIRLPTIDSEYYDYLDTSVKAVRSRQRRPLRVVR